MASSSDMSETEFCYSSCPSNPYNCRLTCFPIPSQFYFPPPPPSSQSNQHISRIVIVISVLAGIFLLVSLCSFIIKHSSRTSTAAINSHGDHDQTDNPSANRIRYVGHMGLEESVINSITVCKYRRAEGTVEGTDCSICLSEFREDEDLRLLPNCRHAFHLPCIDMWLKSHENCPLCRTNVLVSSQMKSSHGIRNSHPESGERPQVRNSRGSTGFGRNGNDGVIASHSSVHVGASELRDLPSSRMNNGFGSNSDSIESNQPREFTIEMMDDDIKRVGRSFSMDSLANLLPIDSEGSSTSIGDGKFIVPKPVRNQTTYKIMGNCSEGPSSQERPASVLKRSFSGGSEFMLARYGGSRESILPM